jgi:hypothetical protein
MTHLSGQDKGPKEKLTVMDCEKNNKKGQKKSFENGSLIDVN